MVPCNKKKSVITNILSKGISLDVKENAIKHIVNVAHEESKGALGARPLKRAIVNLIETELSNIILLEGDMINKITVSCKNSSMIFTTKQIQTLSNKQTRNQQGSGRSGGLAPHG